MKSNWQRKVVSLSLVFAVALSLFTSMPLHANAAEQDIVVLYTNDVHCGVDDKIGYAGLALLEKQMQQTTPYVTLVDAGDAIQGAPIGTLSDGAYLIDIMNKVGYDFAIPGNHEFDYGMNRFLELAGKANSGYYSCNFMNLATGETVFAPYKMFDYGDTKVAYVGVTTPESFTKSTPAHFQDGNGNYIYGFCEDSTGQKLYAAVQSAVDTARKEGADYVILVGHLGEKGITEYWNSKSVINNTNGIDICIDGHSHEIIPAETVSNKDGKAVSITQTGTKLAYVGKVTIRPDGTITSELIAGIPAVNTTSTYTVQKGDSLNRIAKRELGSYQRWDEIYQANKEQIKDPDILTVGSAILLPNGFMNKDGKAMDYDTDRYIKSIQAQFAETLKVVLGHTDQELTVNDAVTGERAVRSAETNLGDLTADAYRYVLGADIGFSNGGGIRSSIKAGDITYEDTLKVFPFGNMGCVAAVTGQQIKDALEMSAKSYPEENGGFLQTSGVTYTINTAISSGVQMDEKGNFIQVNGAYRVSDIMVNGEPLDIGKTYTVASHNYMLKSGGDGMSMFTGCDIVKDEVMADVDLLSAYIRSLGGNVGADYANPSGQGRVFIK